jgi:hypothetical protein
MKFYIRQLAAKSFPPSSRLPSSQIRASAFVKSFRLRLRYTGQAENTEIFLDTDSFDKLRTSDTDLHGILSQRKTIFNRGLTQIKFSHRGHRKKEKFLRRLFKR